jgi:hypothetical protein
MGFVSEYVVPVDYYYCHAGRNVVRENECIIGLLKSKEVKLPRKQVRAESSSAFRLSKQMARNQGSGSPRDGNILVVANADAKTN